MAACQAWAVGTQVPAYPTERQDAELDGDQLRFGRMPSHWGLGILEKAGCRYQAAQLSARTFRVASRCVVRGVGIATSEAIVAVHGEGEFDMQVHVDEGSQQYRARQAGCRIAECSASGSQ